MIHSSFPSHPRLEGWQRWPRSPAIAAIAAIAAGCGSAASNGSWAGAGGSDGVGGGGTSAVTTSGFGGFGTGGTMPAVSLAASAIAVGASHTCALLGGGHVACWGDGALGQLGDGTSGTDNHRALAVAIPNLSGATAIRASGDTTCAILGDTTVACWGDGAFGQLGDGIGMDGHFVASPTIAHGLTGVVDLALSGQSACAALSDGTVRCWGRNAPQEWLGFSSADCGPYSVAMYGSTALVAYPCETAPRPVPGASGIVAIATGGEHTCGVDGTGNVVCWGADNFGQLGDGLSGPTAYDPTPMPVKGGAPASRVALGASHTCALARDSQKVSCWGDNSYGQLGIGSNALDSYKTQPNDVPNLDHVVDFSAADRATCAVLRDQTVACWGDTTNLFPPPDGGTASPGLSPTTADGVAGAIEVRIGSSHACVRHIDASVTCWGLNDRGQLGNGMMSLGDYSLEPVAPPK